MYLKVTPLHHSSEVGPEEIQDFNRTNGPWQKSAAETVATGGIAATAAAALQFIYFLHMAGDATNASNQLFLVAISVFIPVMNESPRVAAH